MANIRLTHDPSSTKPQCLALGQQCQETANRRLHLDYALVIGAKIQSKQRVIYVWWAQISRQYAFPHRIG